MSDRPSVVAGVYRPLPKTTCSPTVWAGALPAAADDPARWRVWMRTRLKSSANRRSMSRRIAGLRGSPCALTVAATCGGTWGSDSDAAEPRLSDSSGAHREQLAPVVAQAHARSNPDAAARLVLAFAISACVLERVIAIPAAPHRGEAGFPALSRVPCRSDLRGRRRAEPCRGVPQACVPARLLVR